MGCNPASRPTPGVCGQARAAEEAARSLRSGADSESRRTLERAVAEARDAGAAEAERRAALKMAEVRGCASARVVCA